MLDFDLDQTLEFLLTPRVIWAVLWAGLAGLTLALLVLMRTRWGQARPLSKCVVLSLFAHVLMMGYASMTELFHDGKASTSGSAIEIDVFTDEQTADAKTNSSPAEADLPPWERLAIDPAQIPEPEELARRDPEFESEPDEARRDLSVTIGARTPAPAVPPENVLRDVPAAADAAVTPDQRVPIVEAAEIQVSPAPRPPPPTPVAPLPAPLDRLATDVAPVALPRRDVADPPPRDADLLSDRLQRLAQVPSASEPAEAVSGPVDRTEHATNQANTSWQSVDPSRADIQDATATGTVGGRTGIPTGGSPRAPLPVEFAEGPAGQPAEATSTVAISSPVSGDSEPMPTMYRFRVREDRQQLAQLRGGTQQAEAAVQAALDWLAAAQNDDGHWDPRLYAGGTQQVVEGEDRQGAGTRADSGLTGLALLAFLANGETHLKGTHRTHVQHGLEYLIRVQARDGNLAGDASNFARMYCHSMATLALGEAYAMTRDDRIRPYLERAVAYSVSAQHPTLGGWRYRPGETGDMSQFGWQLMALTSAQAAGIQVPPQTEGLMRRFLASCSSGRHGGLASYRAGERTSRPMTAEALACRFFLNDRLDDPLVNEARDYVMAEIPGQGRPNYYYWYYGTLALYQVQGEAWDRWNEALQRQLLPAQREVGPLAGSWDPSTVWGGCGGRVYSTAIATLCLEVYYRYLPLYDRAQRPTD